jgi:hypothetical protein
MNKTRRKHKLHWRVDYYSTVDRHCTITVSPGVRSYVASYYCTLGIQYVLSGYIIILRFSPVYHFHQNNANFHYQLKGLYRIEKEGSLTFHRWKTYLSDANEERHRTDLFNQIYWQKKSEAADCVLRVNLAQQSSMDDRTLWKGRKWTT